MRLFTLALAAACAASPALAKKMTLSPVVSFQFVGEIEEGYDSEGSNCALIRDGQVNMYDQPTGYGEIGNMEGQFYADDRRANFEFSLSGIKKLKRATLLFDAYDQYGDGNSSNCVFAYSGNGGVDLADYMPNDRFEILAFGLEWNNDDGSYGLNGMFDVTALLMQMVDAGGGFLGLQFATDNYADTVISLSRMRIEIQSAPEPAALALFGFGIVGLVVGRRRAG